MTTTYVGSLSIGEAVPGLNALGIAGSLGINLALPDIQARLAALLNFQVTPPSLSAQLALATQLVASLQAAIAIGITPPSIDAQLAIVAALIVDLQNAILSIQAQFNIILDIRGLLNAAGVHAYVYQGPVADMGSELTAELIHGPPGGGPSDSAQAIVLMTSLGPTWTALAQLLKVVP